MERINDEVCAFDTTSHLSHVRACLRGPILIDSDIVLIYSDVYTRVCLKFLSKEVAPFFCSYTLALTF